MLKMDIRLLSVFVVFCVLCVGAWGGVVKRSIIQDLDEDRWSQNTGRGFRGVFTPSKFSGGRYNIPYASGWSRLRPAYGPSGTSNVHPWQVGYNTRDVKRNSFMDMLKTLQINSGHRFKPMRFGAGLGRK